MLCHSQLMHKVIQLLSSNLTEERKEGRKTVAFISESTPICNARDNGKPFADMISIPFLHACCRQMYACSLF
jgi:hypothetical protein